MSESRRIGNLLKHAYEGLPWYGTPLRTLLDSVTPDQATAHPIPGAHSIWQEVRHLIAWRQVACRLLVGEEAADLSDPQNWPAPSEGRADSWLKALDELAQTQESLQAAIGPLTDEQLSEKAPGKAYSLYILLHGVIQHDAYHAGQIALLRNALK